MKAQKSKEWGEAVAVEYLRDNGYLIVERSPTLDGVARMPDIITWHRPKDTIVFVAVRTRTERSYSVRLLLTKQTITAMRRAMRRWCAANKWQGAARIDCIEVYGKPGENAPCIDHIMNIKNR